MSHPIARVVTAGTGALLTVAAAWSCPVPLGADSSYHSLSRLAPLMKTFGIADRVADTAGGTTRTPGGIPCVDGFADVYPCNNVDLLARLSLSSLGGGGGNDIWGWTDPVTGTEYAIMGKTNGTAFVDLSDPTDPVYLGTLPTHTSSSSWRDVKVFDNHAFIVSEASGHGMQVFDLTELRGVTLPRTFTATTHYAAFGSAHNIVVNEDTGFAYAVGTRNADDGCAGGLHMIDVSRPAVPVFSGCYAGDGYTHDAQCVLYDGPDGAYVGREICFNYNEDTLTIVDVTSKAEPLLLARQPYVGSGYTHQGWVTDDHAFLLLDDEGDETSFGHNTRTYIWDIADLDTPRMTGSYLASTGAIDHNLYVHDNFVYQANYRAGLRILDVSGIGDNALVQNGFFDVYPTSDSASFNGAWSVYPYFDSGIVIVSGIEQGLFVLRPTALEPGFVVNSQADRLSVCGADVQSAFIEVAPVGSYDGQVTLSASGAPQGTSVSFTPAAVTPPANAIVRVEVATPQPGVWPLTVTGADDEISFETPLRLEISEALPAMPELLLPQSGAADVSGAQRLYWSAAAGAFGYDLEVATDPAFVNTVVAVSDTGELSFQPPAALEPGVVHYWRVTARNACGEAVSATGSFVTTAPSCTVYASADVPRTIPAGFTGTVTSTLATSAPGVVVDANVLDLRGTHSWFNDLSFRLEGPAEPERPSVLLMAQSCNNENDFDLNLDDEAAPGPWPCPPTDGGTYQPTNPLAGFDGASGTGEWTLVVGDAFAADGGSLQGWSLELCTTPAAQILDEDADGVDDVGDNCLGRANPGQTDSDADGFGNACDPDFDNDGVVSFSDLGILRQQFFGADAAVDLNGDGVVNFGDLGILKGFFFGPPGPSALVR